MSSDELYVMSSIVAWASALTAAFSCNLLCLYLILACEFLNKGEAAHISATFSLQGILSKHFIAEKVMTQILSQACLSGITTEPHEYLEVFSPPGGSHPQ